MRQLASLPFSLRRSYRSPLQRKKVVIIGAGWSGFRFAKSINRQHFDVQLISPRNYFLFTPLLCQTTVGTLEFRNITEPVRTIRDMEYHQAHAASIDLKKQVVHCKEYCKGIPFDVPYDALVLAPGARANDFGVPGVSEYCYFLKQLSDARAIRNRILQCFERAETPGISAAERKRLLTFVIVGGGPTSVEFAAELHDFLVQDVCKLYPHVQDAISITLVEASDHILGTFSSQLAQYTEKLYRSRNIKLLTNKSVQKVEAKVITLSDGSMIPNGITVWSTGNAPIPFVKSLDWAKQDRSGRLLVNSHYACIGPDKNPKKPLENVFAIGDCAVGADGPLPPTAQVAQQQGLWLAKALNQSNCEAIDFYKLPAFKYTHRATLAYIGGHQALVDIDQYMIKGASAWLVWNSAYLSMLLSVKNMISVPLTWARSFVFGRDISQF